MLPLFPALPLHMFLGLLCLGLSLARLRISSIMLGDLLGERVGIRTGFISLGALLPSASSNRARSIRVLGIRGIGVLAGLFDFRRLLGAGISYLPLPFRGAFGFLRGFFLP